jgi:GNAT superfamily N-acetyltransferase
VNELTLAQAGPEDVATIAALRGAVADDLTRRFGRGHWSSHATERGVLSGMRHGIMLTARSRGEVVGVLRLGRRRPWAIDPAYFTAVRVPLYLTDMAVAPEHQGEGVGRRLMEKALEVAGAWPSDAIRLDAYDAEAGGGGFYARCGFRERGRVRYRGVPLVYFEKVLRADRPVDAREDVRWGAP